VQAGLARRGQYRISWSCLVIAAVAERHGVTPLHDNSSYDQIAEFTGQA
jgi:predicted nucleic acid-binding protein